MLHCSVLIDGCPLATTEFERATRTRVTMNQEPSGEVFAQRHVSAEGPRLIHRWEREVGWPPR